MRVSPGTPCMATSVGHNIARAQDATETGCGICFGSCAMPSAVPRRPCQPVLECTRTRPCWSSYPRCESLQVGHLLSLRQSGGTGRAWSLPRSPPTLFLQHDTRKIQTNVKNSETMVQQNRNLVRLFVAKGPERGSLASITSYSSCIAPYACLSLGSGRHIHRCHGL